jgi:hypothetical protein
MTPGQDSDAAEVAPGSRYEHPAAPGVHDNGEPYWPAQVTVLAALLLQVTLPHRLTVGPVWLLPSLEGALLLGLAMTTPRRHHDDNPARRRVALGLIALVNTANAVSLYLLAHELLNKHVTNGHELIVSGVVIWLTNVLIFGLWYWEIDRGGPGRRAHDGGGPADFLFSQMGDAMPFVPIDWMPRFVDYLYLSLTSATAFSPTDTLPISPHAKTLMGVQGLVSLVTLGLVISRAVNILG